MSRIEAIFAKLKTISDWKLWLIFFVYSLGISLLIQLFLLPYVFPQWHAGNGLIIGGDFLRFHKYAAEQAGSVAQLGWDQFGLYPRGQFVSGIASFFYILIIPSPAVVLPLNAALHATAGYLCFKIIYKLTQERLPSLLGASLFVIFPSSLRWVSQMHNENYAVPGAILFLYGWTQLDTFLESRTYRHLLFGSLSILGGLLLTGLVRDYLLQVYFAASVLLGLYLIAKALIRRSTRANWIGIGSILILLLLQYATSKFVFEPFILLFRSGTPSVSQAIERISTYLEVDARTAEGQELTEFLASDREAYLFPDSVWSRVFEDRKEAATLWIKSEFLPDWADDQIRELIVKRRSVARNWSDGKSGIDTEVFIGSSVDAMLYAPRALQIALLAPFPEHWFGEGAKLPSAFMRQMAAIEMSCVYLLLLPLLLGLFKWRRSSTLHLVVIFSLFFLIIFAMATPNVGNLYRFRYPFFMLLVSLGATSAIFLLRSRVRGVRAEPETALETDRDAAA